MLISFWRCWVRIGAPPYPQYFDILTRARTKALVSSSSRRCALLLFLVSFHFPCFRLAVNSPSNFTFTLPANLSIMHLVLTMDSLPASRLSFMQKSRKASISSASTTLDSTVHSGLGDSLASTGGGLVAGNEADEPMIRQIRHSGSKFASEVHDRASKLHDRTLLEVATEVAAKQNIAVENSADRVEDRFASHMNHTQTDKQLAQLRNERRTCKAVVGEESEEVDSLAKSLDKFWEREQRKSIYYVTSNLHHLVLVGDDKVMTYPGYQFSHSMPQYNFAVAPAHTMNPCSA